MRQEQSLADLTIGQTLDSELGDLKLLGRELIAGIGPARAECLARGAQLLPRTIAPPGRTEDVEKFDRFAQRRSRLDPAPLPAQPRARWAGASSGPPFMALRVRSGPAIRSSRSGSFPRSPATSPAIKSPVRPYCG